MTTLAVESMQPSTTASERKPSGEAAPTLIDTLREQMAALGLEANLDANVSEAEAARGLVETLVALTRFALEVDGLVRGVLSKYAQADDTMRTLWQAFGQRNELTGLVARAVGSGKPHGARVLSVKLRLLYAWMFAALFGCDSALASLGPELRTQLQERTAEDPQQKVKDFVRHDGPELFEERMSRLVGRKVALLYGREFG